jgi:UTP--glucose-1-phosphate uridylyltransferase
VSRYGIMGGSFLSDRIMLVSEMVEKPAPPAKTPVQLGRGRTLIFSLTEIFQAIEQTPRGQGNEIQITDPCVFCCKPRASLL